MWLIFKKEMAELVRDRKTLFYMIALPVLLFPLLFGAVGFFASKAIQEAESKVLRYSVVNPDYYPELLEKLEEDSQFGKVELNGNSIEEAIRIEQVDFVLVLDEKAAGSVLESGQTEIQLHLNDADLNMVYGRVNQIVKDLSEAKQQAAFSTLSLTETQQKALLKPIILKKVDLADARENWGEKIGGFIPYMIFMLCLQGAMFPASDLGAGEKERGTLETLLISPVARTQIVMGKFLTIATAGVTAALITVVSMAGWGIAIGQGMAIQFINDFMGQIGLLDFFLMFLMLIPVVAVFAAILLSLSIYARSYKEAQSYMGSLVLFLILPIIMATLPGVSLEGIWVWVPLTNVALAIKELVKGTMDYAALFGILGSTIIIAGALMSFCVWWFKKETVLFR